MVWKNMVQTDTEHVII